jgi:glucosamine 6-phosphate synthetase-like amidotransferase/phosphosugar isomerase protein
MAVTARQFIGNMAFQFKGENHTFLGHTRYATQGDKTSTLQAHPFNGQRFILFHNGIIQDIDQKRLSKRFGIVAPNGVDSELFLAFLEKHGSVDKLRDEFLPALSEHSTYALVIFDKMTKNVHLMRCDGRTLALGKTAGNGLFYGSTAEILQAAIGKRAVTVEMLQEYTHVEISSFSGEILRKCAIGRAKAGLGIEDAKDYINRYKKPIRFF